MRISGIAEELAKSPCEPVAHLVLVYFLCFFDDVVCGGPAGYGGQNLGNKRAELVYAEWENFAKFSEQERPLRAGLFSDIVLQNSSPFWSFPLMESSLMANHLPSGVQFFPRVG